MIERTLLKIGLSADVLEQIGRVCMYVSAGAGVLTYVVLFLDSFFDIKVWEILP